MKRNWSDNSEFDRQQQDTCSRLKRKGYPEWTINKKKQKRVSNLPRNTLLETGRKKRNDQWSNQNKPIIFSTQYSEYYKSVTQVIKRHLPIFSSHDNLRHILQNGIEFVSRRAKTIGNIVSHSMYLKEDYHAQTWLHTNGSFPCGHKLCTACKHTSKTESFLSIKSRKKYTINYFLNCYTKNVVYLITCTKCSLQYVGIFQTQSYHRPPTCLQCQSISMLYIKGTLPALGSAA